MKVVTVIVATCMAVALAGCSKQSGVEDGSQTEETPAEVRSSPVAENVDCYESDVGGIDACLKAELDRAEAGIAKNLRQVELQGAWDFERVNAAQKQWAEYADSQCGIRRDGAVDYETECLVRLSEARRDELERLIID